MLFAESFPAWLNVVNQEGERTILEKIFPRGFTIKLVLTSWALLGSFLIYFLLSDFRNKLLEDILEEPVETAEDVLERGLIPSITPDGVGVVYALKRSPNPVAKQLGNTTVISPNMPYVLKLLREDVIGEGVYTLRTLAISFLTTFYGII